MITRYNTTTLRNGLTVIDKYYINRKQAENCQKKLIQDCGLKTYIWHQDGRIFYVVIEEQQ